jgi:hypothetical protein
MLLKQPLSARYSRLVSCTLLAGLPNVFGFFYFGLNLSSCFGNGVSTKCTFHEDLAAMGCAETFVARAIAFITEKRSDS